MNQAKPLKPRKKKPKIQITIENKRVSINKGSEYVWLDVVGDIVHIYATSRNGGYVVASLKFKSNEVELLET